MDDRVSEGDRNRLEQDAASPISTGNHVSNNFRNQLDLGAWVSAAPYVK